MADDPIKHVIVLMLENRSFDHMLGGLGPELGFEGIPKDPPSNSDGLIDYVQGLGASRVLRFDPRHDVADVMQQLANDNGGFVRDFAATYPFSLAADRAEIMKSHTELPALHMLARSFTVCDHWFASVPGPTWANRFFVHSGTSLGRVAMPNGILDANLHWYDQVTLYDRLNQAQKRWAIYYGDIPQSLILVHQLEPQNACKYRQMTRFFEDAAGPTDAFPEYSFIEPTYYQPGANDDHPTHDIMDGDRLIAAVYNALRANPDLWASSLLVVLFDEHGGFYDHVSPPGAMPPDYHTDEYTFDRLGVRVPAILVSPYAPIQTLSTVFDHTSLLKYLTDKWGLGPLGARTANAASFAVGLSGSPRADTPEVLPDVAPSPGGVANAPPLGRPELNSHQSALFAMTQLLESITDVADAPLRSRIQRLVTGFDGAVDVAMERVEDFFTQARADPSAGSGGPVSGSAGSA
jgi:phospholipase C